MPNKLSQFWQELKRRNVVRVVTVYAGAAFVILELVDMVREPFELPNWSFKLVIVILSIGFIIAVILSWIYDIHPEEGMVKTEPVDKIKPEDIPKSSNSLKIARYISFVVIVGLIVLNIIPRAAKQEVLATSIAVLPFDNLSNNEEDNYLGGAFCDEIIMELQKIKAFDRVVSRTSTMQYGKDRPTIPEIAEKLNVNYIVEGSIQRSQQNVRIRVQVIRANNEDHIWAEEYDREWKDIFSIQDEIAFRVAQELQLTLTPEEKELIEKIPTSSISAYNLYLKGKYESESSSGSSQRAILLYEQALKEDPLFALAYVGMAWEYFTMSFDKAPSKRTYSDVNEYLNKALEIDSTMAEAYSMLGTINTYYYWNWKVAEKNFSRALQINPKLGSAHEEYAVLLILSNRPEEAITEALRAMEDDPLSSNANTILGMAYFHNREYDKAIEELEKVIRTDPNYSNALGWLAEVYRASSMLEQAIIIAERNVDLSRGRSVNLVDLGLSYYENGDIAKAEEIFNTLENNSIGSYVPPVLLYKFYHIKEDEDLAFYWFKQAVDQRDFWLLWENVNPDEKYGFPNELRYNALLNEVGLENY